MRSTPLPLLPLVLDDVPLGLRQALAQEGIACCDRRPGAIDGRFVLFDSKHGRPTGLDVGQTPIDVQELRAPGEPDPFAALTDMRAARHAWEVGGWTVEEEVSRVDKRAVRRRLMGALRELLESYGGIWLRVAPFPFPYRSAFAMRIDHDHYVAADFQTVLEVLQGWEGVSTHVVSGAALGPFSEALARLKGLDVASHGYWHHTYRTVEENLRNLSRGMDVLRAGGLDPHGFAAPHGRYNQALAAALEALGVAYSSEFGLAHDDWPFFPGSSQVLQIPVHPVCLGLLLEAARRRSPDDPMALAKAAEAGARHFQAVAEAKYRAGEPILLYGHPDGRLGRFPHVLRAVLDAVAPKAALWKTTFRQIDQWWHLRSRVRLTVTQTGHQYQVTVDSPAMPWRLGIEYWRGEHVALMPVDGRIVRFHPQSLAYERRPWAPTVRVLRVDHAHGLRSHVRRLLDWERVTPPEEITKGTWQNWAKRALRRWWG